MAARGFVALAFDHRTFGESGGEPRQFESPPRKVEDIRAAAAFLSRHAGMKGLPIGAVGVCAGGGYMAAAVADEPRLQAFAAVAGVFPDAEATRRSMGAAYDAAIAAARSARERYEAGQPAERIPAVGEGNVAMPLAEAFEFYGTPRGAVPNYVNSFAVQSREVTLPFDTMGVADRIQVPTLMVHSERALVPAWARAFYNRVQAPKQELWLDSRGQIDFYDDPRLIDQAADAMRQHFAGCLG
ncbi:MAG TPA: alpha/beta hydrolase [Povalibacter sp.]|nr:alpha/beta hydrolase [Povalibacter sp.]